MMPDERDLVCVVEDDARVRHSLCGLIEFLGVRTESYANGQAFLDDPLCEECTCLILDVRMPGLSGLDVQARLVDRGIRIPIIFVTGHGDVPMAVISMRSGALDFLQKPINDQSLLDRVQHALDLGRKMRHEALLWATVNARLSALTHREQEVLQALVAGKMNKVIAGELGLSVRTVEDYRANIMKKMQVDSLAELVLLVSEIQKTRFP